MKSRKRFVANASVSVSDSLFSGIGFLIQKTNHPSN
jgi:hypothetical protein